MAADRRVLVLGGDGFIGRHAVAALRDRHADVVVGSRRASPGPGDALQRRVARFEALLDAKAWAPVLEQVDVVLNCVGILRPTGTATYERVHHQAVAALAAACALRAVPLVHVSALGLEHPARSGFLRSKARGEAALMRSKADWRIVRPALLDGERGYGALWIRQVARWPVHPFPADATGRLAPLDARDLGAALAALCLCPPRANGNPFSRIFELGGPEVRDIAAHLEAMDASGRTRRLRLPVPGWAARLASHACDLLHATPFSYGHLELLRRDNLPRANRIAELLGRAPRAVCARPAEVPASAVPARAAR